MRAITIFEEHACMLGLIEKARALLVGLAPFFVFYAGLEIAGLALAIERLGARPQPRLAFEALLVGFPNALAALHFAVILSVAVASHVAIGVLAAVLAGHAFPAPQAVVLRAAYRLRELPAHVYASSCRDCAAAGLQARRCLFPRHVPIGRQDRVGLGGFGNGDAPPGRASAAPGRGCCAARLAHQAAAAIDGALVDELGVGQLKHSKIALRAECACLRADLVSFIAGLEIALGGHCAEVSEQNHGCDAGSIGVAHLLATRQW
jgi:hypothetical protein